MEIATSRDPQFVCEESCEWGIAGGGGLTNCFFSSKDVWQCYHIDGSQDWVPSEGENSIIFTCEILPVFEADEDNCDCFIHLGEATQEPDLDAICRTCVILPSTNTTDGISEYHYDCSDLLEGTCVGTHQGGCISSQDASCSQGIVETGLEGAPAQQLIFDIEVSTGDTVRCETSGGTGDAGEYGKSVVFVAGLPVHQLIINYVLFSLQTCT